MAYSLHMTKPNLVGFFFCEKKHLALKKFVLWNFSYKVLFGKSDSVGPNSIMIIVFDHTYIYIFLNLNNELNNNNNKMVNICNWS